MLLDIRAFDSRPELNPRSIRGSTSKYVAFFYEEGTASHTSLIFASWSPVYTLARCPLVSNAFLSLSAWINSSHSTRLFGTSTIQRNIMLKTPLYRKQVMSELDGTPKRHVQRKQKCEWHVIIVVRICNDSWRYKWPYEGRRFPDLNDFVRSTCMVADQGNTRTTENNAKKRNLRGEKFT